MSTVIAESKIPETVPISKAAADSAQPPDRPPLKNVVAVAQAYEEAPIELNGQTMVGFPLAAECKESDRTVQLVVVDNCVTSREFDAFQDAVHASGVTDQGPRVTSDNQDTQSASFGPTAATSLGANRSVEGMFSPDGPMKPAAAGLSAEDQVHLTKFWKLYPPEDGVFDIMNPRIGSYYENTVGQCWINKCRLKQKLAETYLKSSSGKEARAVKNMWKRLVVTGEISQAFQNYTNVLQDCKCVNSKCSVVWDNTVYRWREDVVSKLLQDETDARFKAEIARIQMGSLDSTHEGQHLAMVHQEMELLKYTPRIPAQFARIQFIANYRDRAAGPLLAIKGGVCRVRKIVRKSIDVDTCAQQQKTGVQGGSKTPDKAKPFSLVQEKERMAKERERMADPVNIGTKFRPLQRGPGPDETPPQAKAREDNTALSQLDQSFTDSVIHAANEFSEDSLVDQNKKTNSESSLMEKYTVGKQYSDARRTVGDIDAADTGEAIPVWHFPDLVVRFPIQLAQYWTDLPLPSPEVATKPTYLRVSHGGFAFANGIYAYAGRQRWENAITGAVIAWNKESTLGDPYDSSNPTFIIDRTKGRWEIRFAGTVS